MAARKPWLQYRMWLLGGGLALFLFVFTRFNPAEVFSLLLRIQWGFLWITLLYAGHQALRTFALSKCLVTGRRVYWWELAKIRLSGEAVQFLTLTGPFLAESAFRGWLADYLRAYAERGNAALVEYQSSRVSVWLGGELQQMFDAKPSLGGLVPEFYEYLTNYPKARASGVRDFLYWSTANFGFKPVTSVSHVTIFQQPGQGVIVSKQIYANHYFDASLGLTFLVDLPADGKPAMYLVYLNRSRIDLLSGWRAGVRKFILRRRLIGGFKDNLRDVSARVGAACKSDAGNAR